MYANIPNELKELPQWVVWRYVQREPGSKPTKEPINPNTGGGAMVNKPSTWGTFEQCVELTQRDDVDGIGFMLSPTDPYTIVDLDNPNELNPDGTFKHESPQNVMDIQTKIYERLESYTEFSPSGLGVHIITRGTLRCGRRRGGIELYSEARFMTMTGNVLRNAPIEDRNAHVNELWEKLGGTPDKEFYDGNVVQTRSDQEIIDMAMNAANSETVMILLSDEWRSRYESQSEADFAFVNIISYYTQNREQIKRLFRMSPLGARNKQTTVRGVPYLDHMINRSFDRMIPPVNIDGLRNMLLAALAKRFEEPQVVNEQIVAPVMISNQPHIEDYEMAKTPKPNIEPPQLVHATSDYTVPPGLVGEIAQFIYEAAPRGVPEMALVGALGLMSGICGRAYNVSNTGLNQYILLLSETGNGKEQIASGIDKLIGAVGKVASGVEKFIGPAEIASPQALAKYLDKTSNSFVSIVGEFGITMEQMASQYAPPHLVGLRRMMLDLFNKSGMGQMLRPTIYSDREKNTTVVQSPSYSMIGESVPDNFYACINESMIASGLLPRFTIVEYKGKRPALSKTYKNAVPSKELIQRVAQLATQAMMLNNTNQAVPVAMTPEAQLMFDRFDSACDERINSATSEVTRHLWNRAHIKAMKLGALLAVGCGPYEPIITQEHAEWALNLVIRDANNMLGRFSQGEIGANTEETKQLKEVQKIIRDYVLKPWSELASYNTPADLHNEKIIPYSFVQRRLATIAVFRGDKMGATNAIKRTIQTLLDRGDISEVGKQLMATKFGTSGRAFMISAAAAFNLA